MTISSETLITAVIAFFIGLVLGTLLIGNWVANGWARMAIQHKAAMYNEKTGEFEWIKSHNSESHGVADNGNSN